MPFHKMPTHSCDRGIPTKQAECASMLDFSVVEGHADRCPNDEPLTKSGRRTRMEQNLRDTLDGIRRRLDEIGVRL